MEIKMFGYFAVIFEINSKVCDGIRTPKVSAIIPF
jgi:hypothetical protein